MPLYIYTSGANRIAQLHVYASGANRAVKEVWVFQSGANRLVYALFSASIPPFPMDESGLLGGHHFSGTTVAASGGSGSYTYVWGFTNQNLGFWTIDAGQGTATAFARVEGVSPASTAEADLYCDVTDTVSNVTVRSNLRHLSYTRN